jgi:hypothetical protein
MTKRIGTVTIGIKYTVDLDNPEMIDIAQDLIREDLEQALIKNSDLEEFKLMIAVKHDPKLTEKDIDQCLLDLCSSHED